MVLTAGRMWTNFVGSLSRSIYVTLGAPAFKTLVSTTKVLYPTLKKNEMKEEQFRKVQINYSNSWAQCRFPDLLLYFSS